MDERIVCNCNINSLKYMLIRHTPFKKKNPKTQCVIGKLYVLYIMLEITTVYNIQKKKKKNVKR